MEKVESTDCSRADEEEDRALNGHVDEGLAIFDLKPLKQCFYGLKPKM